MTNISQAAQPEHVADPAVSVFDDPLTCEHMFGAPVTVTAEPPVTDGTDDLVCHPHDPRGPAPDPAGRWAQITYVTRLGGTRVVWCCERCLLEFVWNCSRDGAVRVEWAGQTAVAEAVAV